MNVAILGASDNPEKYSHKALTLLRQKGHAVFPVHPKLKKIEGISVYESILDIPVPVDTATLYLSPETSSKIGEDILEANPRRLIFNPGAENPSLEAQAQSRGIQALEACTLVLLTTNRF